ncbi:MAG: hypothetical protein HQL69_06930, partial [Magnetococcales bacterium]|nr:hypothetical protein [Magnetococcales bacterium]
MNGYLALLALVAMIGAFLVKMGIAKKKEQAKASIPAPAPQVSPQSSPAPAPVCGCALSGLLIVCYPCHRLDR